MVKFQNPFVFCIILAITIFLHKKGDTQKVVESKTVKDFKLVVERGAFHFDRFELTPTQISYFPENDAAHGIVKYNSISEVKLDSIKTIALFKDLDNKGFQNLKNRYEASSSCLSELKITLVANGETKSVICDDFERSCPELIKYIDKKVVELEGNDLKRIYLPG